VQPDSAIVERLEDVPYLPVGLFKTHRLVSVPETEIFKVLTSSGTTGQTVSQIVLDRETARKQTTALADIMTRLLGPKRLPMLIVDNPTVFRSRQQLTARAAAVAGMLNFGQSHVWVLDEQMELQVGALKNFLNSYGSAPFLIFGVTFLIWRSFCSQLVDLGLDCSNAILIHTGGWKRLEGEAVGRTEFKRGLATVCGISRVHDFYGLAEQVGSVFLEGDDGFLHAPNFADVIVRDPLSWKVADVGQPGILQVLSALPHSYPGHSLLTEDIAVVHGIDDSPSGWRGKYFSVLGRISDSDRKGCSDTPGVALRAS
jgi:hypothetical protein